MSLRSNTYSLQIKGDPNHIYDASYIALAQEVNGEFLTADERLVKAASSLGFVKLS